MTSCGGREQFVIRTSDRSIFKSCRQRWDFTSKIRQDFEPKGVQVHFDFGTSIHEGLASYYKFAGHEHRVELAMASFISSEGAFRQFAKGAFLDGNITPELEQQFVERRVLGMGMLEHYFEFYKNGDDFTPVKVEIEFEVPIPATHVEIQDLGGSLGIFQAVDNILYHYCASCNTSHPVVYQGRCDMVVMNKWGHYWIWDHKTAAQFGSTEYLDLDDQCGSYIWALRDMLGLDIRGVVYNRLLKAVPHPPAILQGGGLSKNKQQRTTYGLYMKALVDHNLPHAPYAEFLEYLKQKPNSFFQRVEVLRSAEEIPIIQRRVLMEALDMLGAPNIYPNPGMFTCMGCAFKVPCVATQDGSDVNFILRSNYQKRAANDISRLDIVGSTDSSELGGITSPPRL